jgi:hypothetical protein
MSTKRRSKFTLSPKPPVSPQRGAPPKIRTVPAVRDVPKVQARQSPPAPTSPPPAGEQIEEEDIFEDDEQVIEGSIKLPRAQLELEYTATLQEHDLLLNQLAGLLEELMVTIPAD